MSLYATHLYRALAPPPTDPDEDDRLYEQARDVGPAGGPPCPPPAGRSSAVKPEEDHDA